MAYSKEIFETAQEIITARRSRAERDAQHRRKAFGLEEPLYPDLQNEIIRSTRDLMRTIGQGEKAKEIIEQSRVKHRTLTRSIADLLAEHGYPEDYLEVHPTCPICQDYGFVETRYCECFTNLLKKLTFDEAAKRTPLQCSRFADFSLHYYTDEQREHMQGIFDYCKGYADTFDRDSYSLLFYGETGLGKTHLSLSIAGELISKGWYVMYDSTQSIMNQLEREHFGKGTGDDYEKLLLECDLLIMDDLGTEFSTQFTLAEFYNILNSRLLQNRPTIISTNLDLKGIENKYTKRIASRIVGEYELLHFVGNDIRQQKKEEE
ncbi:MAG: ATP-binding protein [Clostridia bacterium]|nr:ATP-binding protein [Clostridia bacterium]